MSRGRLIKKVDQDKNNSVTVESYPWTDFSTDSILLPDNPRKSVVQSKSHSTQEMERKVKTPDEFSKVLSTPMKPILPQDLTAEYIASQEELRQRKRRMQMDEDEAVALELLDLDDGLSESAQDGEKPAEMVQTNVADLRVTSAQNSGVARTGSPDISDLTAFSSEKKLELDDGTFEFPPEPAVQQDLQEKITAAFERGLQQGKAEGEKVGYEAAMNSIQQAGGTEQQTDDTAEVLKQQSYEQGLEQGRADAREAAVIEAEEKFGHSVKLFTSALTELQHLKGELISTGREIFAEIAQICAEKVLRTSVRLNDDALRKIYESATSQFSLDNKLQIEMHPDDLARLEPHIADTEKDRIRLVGNDKIKQGDLKIEANNEVISLDLNSTVQQIIDALKDDLFENAKKDDSTDKAG